MLGGDVAPMLGAGVGGAVVVEVGAGVVVVEVGVGVGVGMPEVGADVGVGSGEPMTVPGDDGIDVGGVDECMDPPVCGVREEPSALFDWVACGACEVAECARALGATTAVAAATMSPAASSAARPFRFRRGGRSSSMPG
jgi:hypothetical protein